MYIKHAGMSRFLCIVKSGVLQGCPLAALLFVIAMEPFLVMFRTSIEDGALGVLRACADDLALVLKDLASLTIVHRIFEFVEQLAGLTLKIRKCFLILLAPDPDSNFLQFLCDFLNQQIPSWANFQVTDAAEYLGIWLGPKAETENWVTQIAKLLDRTALISDAGPPTSLAIGTYNVKAVTVLSYPTQFFPPPKYSYD